MAALLLAVGCGGSGAPEPTPPKPTASATPTATPRTDAAAVAARANIPVLCYHQIRTPTAADGAQARPYIVRPSVFAAQMRALDDAGYTTVTGDALVAHVLRGEPLPRKPVLLTFDDASAGQYTEAFPVLRRHRFKATFFIMTVVLGKPGWLTRGQVRKLDRAGMTIGTHTWDHKAVPEYAGADWETQVEQPTRALEKLVGHPVRLFAYPFGLRTREAIPHLLKAGLRAGFQLADPIDRRHPAWTIRRIIVPELSGKQLLRELRTSF
ncbi:polysaccharide deacetylase [Solirubrobacter pauli]|uniref:Polysaccharide deacetylase n=2 Tax=Solirubrobacter pauli TaxID=166793 RepID=A0A660L072_9ACTN|nr:polysaccharide deacetylase [Solirubrobacter pauli]